MAKSNDPTLYIIVEQGRDSKLWYATTKQLPGLEELGSTPYDAEVNLSQQIEKRHPRFLFSKMEVKKIDAE